MRTIPSEEAIAEIALKAVEAAARPEAWPALCDTICAQLDARAFMIFAYDLAEHRAPAFFGSAVTYKPEVRRHVEMVLSGEAREDHPGYEIVGRSTPGTPLGEADFFPDRTPEERAANRFRRAALGVTGSRARSAIKINDVGPFLDCAISHDPDPSEWASPGMRQLGPFLAPLLARTLEATRIVAALTRSYRMLLDLFEQLDFGAAFCEPSGRILTANRTFREIMAGRDGLSDAGGMLSATRASDMEALQRILAAAHEAQAPPGAFTATVGRRSRGLPYVLQAVPVREPDLRAAPVSLVLLIDPETGERLTARGLAAFGLLSAAELDVCDLIVRGMGTEEIARARDTSLETVRSQIKASAAKLACRTRLDVVRLALATRAPLREDGGHPPAGG